MEEETAETKVQIAKFKSQKKLELIQQKRCDHCSNIEAWSLDILYISISIMGIILCMFLPHNILITALLIILTVLIILTALSKQIAFFAFTKAYVDSQDRFINYEKAMNSIESDEYEKWYNSRGLERRVRWATFLRFLIPTINVINLLLFISAIAITAVIIYTK